MSTRMELKKEKKKVAILDAAEKIIAENGFRAMTMDQVAKDADVAKGTLYLYFKNKGSLCAAVNARINKEMNAVIKEKMDICKTGSGKIVASGTAIIEFSLKNPQKWNAGTELYQMKFENPKDPNVKEFLREVNNMIQMLAEAYIQGMDEGTIRQDLDPVSTAIYNRMALSNAFTPTSEQKMLLNLNNISQEHYLDVSWNLINRSTHIKPSIREESEKSMENINFDQLAEEVKAIVGSMELSTENAIEINNAWVHLVTILMGTPEYQIIAANKDYVVAHVTKCNILETHRETDLPEISMSEGCSKYCTNLVESLNPKYTQRFTKKICEGDSYCESIVELKK